MKKITVLLVLALFSSVVSAQTNKKEDKDGNKYNNKQAENILGYYESTSFQYSLRNWFNKIQTNKARVALRNQCLDGLNQIKELPINEYSYKTGLIKKDRSYPADYFFVLVFNKLARPSSSDEFSPYIFLQLEEFVEEVLYAFPVAMYPEAASELNKDINKRDIDNLKIKASVVGTTQILLSFKCFSRFNTEQERNIETQTSTR